MPKTKLDLFLSAFAFARDTLTTANAHAIATAALDRFKSEQQHPDDWEYWNLSQDEHRQKMLGLKNQNAQSVISAAPPLKAESKK